MHRKTIGGFIAALRKANGMTQKELADRLSVSDKTVSRWERDDGTPDLSVIPVIAEIFGVTCDELLRGERTPPQERTPCDGECAATPRGEKQRQRLLNAALSQYQSQTFFAMGISVCGGIAALICNLAFLKARLGFLCGAVFFTVSLLCQAIFVNRTLFSVQDDQLNQAQLAPFRLSIVRLAQASVGVTVGCLGFFSPLLFVDAFAGLSAASMCIFGAAGAAFLLLVYAIACHVLHAVLLKKGFLTLGEKQAIVWAHNHRLKQNCALALALMLAVTFVCHRATTALWGPFSVMEGTTLHDSESFVAFMEQDVPFPHEPDSPHAPDAPTPAEQNALADDGIVHYYDQEGNEIPEQDALRHTLEDKNGTVVCEYLQKTTASFRCATQSRTAPFCPSQFVPMTTWKGPGKPYRPATWCFVPCTLHRLPPWGFFTSKNVCAANKKRLSSFLGRRLFIKHPLQDRRGAAKISFAARAARPFPISDCPVYALPPLCPAPCGHAACPQQAPGTPFSLHPLDKPAILHYNIADIYLTKQDRGGVRL